MILNAEYNASVQDTSIDDFFSPKFDFISLTQRRRHDD